MNHLLFFVYVTLTAGMFSLLEIQAEGKDGWAAKFPTWRIENKWTKMFLAGRPLTGYHVSFFLFMLFIGHLPFGLGLVYPTLKSELRLISFLVFFFLIEDFLWFILNPAFGLRKFTRDNIWWHSFHWWGFMPRDYWIFTLIAVILYILSL